MSNANAICCASARPVSDCKTTKLYYIKFPLNLRVRNPGHQLLLPCIDSTAGRLALRRFVLRYIHSALAGELLVHFKLRAS